MKINDIYKKLTIYLQENKKLYQFVVIFVSFLLAVPGSVLGYSGAMRSVDNMFEDTAYQVQREVNPDIFVIPVTSENTELFNANTLDIGSLAGLINSLNSDPVNKPAVIGIANVVRSMGDAKEDEELLSAVQSNNVVLGNMFDFSDRVLVGDESCVNDNFEIYKRHDPSMIFDSKCKSGYLNVAADTDGVVRNYYWNAKIDGTKIKSFAEVVYDVYCDNKGIVAADRFTPPYSKDGFTMIPFSTKPGGFNSLDYNEIMAGAIDPTVYSGKIVIIGTADNVLNMGYTTAISRNEYMYNCDLQANVICNLLEHKSLMQVPLAIQLAILTVVTWIMAILVIEFPFIYSLVYSILSLVICFVLAGILWDKGWTIHPLYYVATMIVAMFVSAFVNVDKLRTRKINENEILSQYLDKNVINQIVNRKNDNEIEISGSSKKVAVLFADIRNFTGISEEIGPENTVNLLNDFLSSAEQCIHTHHGTVDKFIGDCIMAFWEDVNNDESVIPQACLAALDIVKTIHEKEEDYFRKYKKEITFGVGIDYGEAILGDIGSTSRKDYTVVGNTVNIASRLESDAPKGMVLISQRVYDSIKYFASCESFGQQLSVRGFAQRLNAYILNSINYIPVIQENEEVVMHDIDDNYVLYTFGTRGSFPVTGRRYSEFGGSTTCFVLKRKKHALVYDCGTGLLEAQEVLSDCTKIDIVLSHMHYDHCIGLLSWFSVFPKDAEVNFYGNFNAWFGKDTLKELFRSPFWPVDYTDGITNNIHSIEEFSGVLSLDDDMVLVFYDSPHPNGASIVNMKVGKRSICFMVDCESNTGLPFDVVKNADILIYDGMLDDSEYEGKIGWGHSTWQKGVELAKKANVGQLIITHHNPDAWDSELRLREKEARKIFKNTEFARNGNKLVFRSED